MTERKPPLNKAQLDAIATGLFFYPRGFIIDPHRVADRMVCDGLVERGDLEAIPDVDGGYRCSDERAQAQLVQAATDAENAANN